MVHLSQFDTMSGASKYLLHRIHYGSSFFFRSKNRVEKGKLSSTPKFHAVRLCVGTLSWALGSGGFTPSHTDRYGKGPIVRTGYEVTGWLQVVAKCVIIVVLLSRVVQLCRPSDSYFTYTGLQ